MELLAEGKYCKNQVVKVGDNAYGIQGHLELTPEMYEIWINQDPDLLKLDTSKLIADYALVKSEYESTGKQILTNFLKTAKLLD